MSKPKIIVCGYDELLLASLDLISTSNAEISAVVFPFNKTEERAEKVRRMVRSRGYKTLIQPPQKQISGFIEKLKALSPDLIFIWSYPLILSSKIIKTSKGGGINLHMGLLPEYRGVNGTRWALINGENETGVTLHFIDEGIDTGDIIATKKIPILPTDDILSLMIKSRAAGLDLLKECWNKVLDGTIKAEPQDESRAQYYSAKMSSIDRIDWSKSNAQINNLIRASVVPFPGVWTNWNDKRLVIRKAVLKNSASVTKDIGQVENISSAGIEVTTGHGNLLVTKIEIDNKEIKAGKIGLKTGDKFI